MYLKRKNKTIIIIIIIIIIIEIPEQMVDFDCFSYPEFCESRNQVEARTIDPSHILTNLRLHATQKGFFKCDPQAFK